MCLDDRLWYSQDKDCLIYSFGIGDDAAFEVSLNKLKPNCEIHMFDSSITEKVMLLTSGYTWYVIVEYMYELNGIQYIYILDSISCF